MYTGTPGSGKSYHATQDIYFRLRKGKNCICNFPIDLEKVKNGGLISRKKVGKLDYIPTLQLTVEYLIQYAKENHSLKKESETIVFIDECAILFNSRNWNAKDRMQWIEFLALHRHYGFDFILITQNDRMVDRQIRGFCEYEIKHRKLNNYKLMGRVLGLLSGGCLFVGLKYWYGAREKIGSSFFRYNRKIAGVYNTFAMLGTEDKN